jgi:hypothetical protein
LDFINPNLSFIQAKKNRMLPLFAKIEIHPVPRRQPRRPHGKIGTKDDLVVKCGMRSAESLREESEGALLEDVKIPGALVVTMNRIIGEAKTSGLGGIALDLSGVDAEVTINALPEIKRICMRHGKTDMIDFVKPRQPQSDLALAYPIARVGFQDGWPLDCNLKMPKRADVFDNDRLLMTGAVFTAVNVAILFAVATRQTAALVMHPYLFIPEMVDSIAQIATAAGIRAEMEEPGLMRLDWTA